MLPILFFEIYLNLSVLLFAFGPWPWPVRNPVKLYTFLLVTHLVLFLGYASTVLRGRPSSSTGYRASTVLSISVALNLVLLPLTFLSRTGQLLPDLRQALLNPGIVYGSTRLVRASESRLFEYVRIVLAPLLFPLIPLTAFYWQGMRGRLKLAALLAILGLLSLSVATGTNKGIADFVFLTPWLILAAHLSGVGKLHRRQKISLLLLFLFAFFLFMTFFTRGQMTRLGSGAPNFYMSRPPMYANTENVFIKALPFDAKVGAVALTGYLTQGYYALSLALERPFVPMFGIGNSMFLFHNVADLLGLQGIKALPYPVRIERFGWDAYGKWSSIYPWLASDVSFVGTLLIVFLIGSLFGLAWRDTLEGINPLAVAMFAQFLIMLFYFPANNQVLQSGEPLVSFYTILIAWLLTRRRLARV
jgi:hypothetical protein